MLHSIYDLTTFCRKTTGDVPAKLVVCSLITLNICIQIYHCCLQGASTTVIGSKMYLFVSTPFPSSILDFKLTERQGGRLVTERRMVSDLYVFDLDTFRWERLPASPQDDVPRARYFHSTDACMKCIPFLWVCRTHSPQQGTIISWYSAA